jgi:hypothetical protein
VPACPGLGAYPGFTCTTTISRMSPEMVEPLWLTESETITAITEGTVAGGLELLPVSVVQVPPQAGAVLLFSKPLKLFGAGPLLS